MRLIQIAGPSVQLDVRIALALIVTLESELYCTSPSGIDGIDESGSF